MNGGKEREKRRLVSEGTTEKGEPYLARLLLDRWVMQEATQAEGVRMLKRPSSSRNYNNLNLGLVESASTGHLRGYQ